MINIISSFGNKAGSGGPGKVFSNLTKGLEKIKYPYVVNGDLNSTKRLWIHDSVTALYSLKQSKAFRVIGPNLFMLPSEVSATIDLVGALYLQPSSWAREFWESAGFGACATKVWPVGIDTDAFRPWGGARPEGPVILYHKRRDAGELQEIRLLLDRLRLPHVLFVYGDYSEREYMAALERAPFIIWHGCHESQGIALQEGLACDVPVLVCDVANLSQEVGGFNFPAALRSMPATAAPYFDEWCGMKIYALGSLEESIGLMRDRRKDFAPREYVLTHLSLDGQARAFVDLWQHWGLTFAEGVEETASIRRAWRPPLASRVRVRIDQKKAARLRGEDESTTAHSDIAGGGATRTQSAAPVLTSLLTYRQQIKHYLAQIPNPALQRWLAAYLEGRYRATEKSKYRKWLRAGKPLPAPAYYKQQVVRDAGAALGIRTLVETGTFEGRMIQALRKDFRRIYSVELDMALFQAASAHFAGDGHITILSGNSGPVLRTLLPTVAEACVFWLDAHYSGGPTSRADKDTPIMEELEAIESRSGRYGDVILIDDSSHFGKGDYPAIQTVKDWAEAHGYDHFEVSDDIMRIYKSFAGEKSTA